MSSGGEQPGKTRQPPAGLARRIWQHPVLMLGGVSVLGLLFSLGQFAVALIVLSPQDFAVIGVMLASGAVVVNVVDVRLIDLSTKLYNDTQTEGPDAQLDILRAGAFIQGVLGLVVFGLSIVASLLSSRWLLSQPVSWPIIISAAAVPAATLISSTFSAYLRILGAFKAFGAFRIVSQGFQVVVVTGLLMIYQDAEAYLTGMGISACVILGFSWLWVLSASQRKHSRSLADTPPSRKAVSAHLARTSFLAAGSAMSLAKMATRSGDVLLVAALSNDMTTGLYRVARQAADSLYAIADSVNQFYGPTIIEAVSRGDLDSHRHLRRRILLIAVVSTLASLAIAIQILPFLGERFAPNYLGAIAPFTVFASALLILIGIHSWLWPALVAQGTIGRFAIASLLGGAAQVLSMIGLHFAGIFSPTTAAACFVFGLAVTYVPFLIERALRRW